MITYSIEPICYKCICRVCGQLGCPHRRGEYKRCFLCMIRHDYSPILDCKNFYRREYPRFRVRRIYKKPSVRYVDKTNADDIRVMLTEILSLLGSGSAPEADVNCIRHSCLCLSCPLSSKCSERCKLCNEYKGQHPVKLCAQLVLYNKSSGK